MEPQQLTDPGARLIPQAGLGVAEKSLNVRSEKDDRKVMISVLTQSLSVCETEFWMAAGWRQNVHHADYTVDGFEHYIFLFDGSKHA